jgi:hypothetical protein
MTRPKCEAMSLQPDGSLSCPRDAVKRLSLDPGQDVLLCLPCRDLIQARAPGIDWNWSCDEARGRTYSACVGNPIQPK